MGAFANTITSFLASSRRSASTQEDAAYAHARRKALLRNGKVAQAAALRKATKAAAPKGGSAK